jgi:hypothetical protein
MGTHHSPASQQAECACLQEIGRQQRRFWLAALIWWISVIVFVVVTTQIIRNVAFTFVQVVFYMSALLLYIPARALSKIRCPHCQRPTGALPVFRYRFLICRTCQERIQCEDQVPDDRRKAPH